MKISVFTGSLGRIKYDFDKLRKLLTDEPLSVFP